MEVDILNYSPTSCFVGHLVHLKQCFFFILGIVLFTFIHFNSTPAIVTSIVIGIGIVFCGGAVVHNVFIWQRVSTYSTLTTVRRGTVKAEYL